jgi:formylglycine-generating enzyme required for sulfatase activity
LIRAAEQGNAEVVKRLLSAGANVNVRDPDGWTPLLRAAVGGHLAVAKIFIEAGADVNAANPDGNTPLMGAALAGNKELVQLLLQKGAKPDAKNQKGLTALTFAQQKGYAEVVKFLRGLTEPQAGEVMRDPTTGMEFIFVKGGCFQMGDTVGDGDPDEKPVHEVCVDGFYMGKYEVTQSQWQRVMGSNFSYFRKGGDYPMEQVSWNDAQDFIRRLNESSGQTYRLPTEVEWEYAARSGGKSEKWTGTNLEYQLGEYGWFSANSGSQTRPVGQKRPNGLGLHDMSGNVWEWCQDWYDKGYYGKSPKENPKGPDSGEEKCLRGGSWHDDAGIARASNRYGNLPALRNGTYGCRLVLSSR